VPATLSRRDRLRGVRRARMPPRWPEPYELPPGREHLAERWLPAFAQRELTQTHSRVIHVRSRQRPA